MNVFIVILGLLNLLVITNIHIKTQISILMLYFSLLKKLNFKKIINFIKVYSGYLFSILLKKGIYFGFPVSISIEPTNLCNLQCIECVSGLRKLDRKLGKLSFDLYKKIIDESSEYLIHLLLYFQGEPFVNKDIIKIIEYAHHKNIFTATSTNGHFLTSELARKTVEAGLDKLIVSLDGTNQQVYEKYRVNGNFDTVILGINNIVYWKKILKSKTPEIVLQFLVMSSNEHQINEIKVIAKNLKIDRLEFKSIQINNIENIYLLPAKEKFRRYNLVNNEIKIKTKLNNKCWRLWNSIVITWEGDVVPCCYDKNAKYTFGNIKELAIKTIIKNDVAFIFRNKVLKNRKSIDICNNCTTK